MSLKPLHSDCLHRIGRALLRKSYIFIPFFQRLIVLLLSITVNPIPSHFPSLGRCALIIMLHFSGSTSILVRLCSIHMLGSVYLSSIL